MLLVGASLLIKSYAKLRHVDPGFHPEHVLTMRVQYPPTRPMMRTRLAAFFTELCDRIATIPGVVSAGAVSRLPVFGGVNGRGGNPFSIEGQCWRPDGPVPQMAHTQIIDTPEYFRAMQIPLLQGRYFSPADNSSAPAVTVVNATLARGFFPKRSHRPSDPPTRRAAARSKWLDPSSA